MRIRIDIGGTKLESAAFDWDGKLHLRCRISTPRGNYAATVDAIARLVEPIESELGQRCTLGSGIPGNISAASGLTKNAYSSPLNRRPLDRNMAARFNRPVALMNDTNCFALSGARVGVAAGAKIVFDTILGTSIGCGSGIVLRGELLTDTAAVSGEFGDIPFHGRRMRKSLACSAITASMGVLRPSYPAPVSLAKRYLYRRTI